MSSTLLSNPSHSRVRWLLSTVGAAAALSFTAPAAAQAVLGTAANFAVLAASTVTNTGPTVVTGGLGLTPGTSVIGFPPGTVIGTIHVADAVAVQAKVDATDAFNALDARPCNTDLTGTDLGGLVLTPGVYCFATSALLSSALVLDAQSNPNAEFVFRIGSTLTTANNASVTVINGGSACNVFWPLGSAATLGINSTLAGNIIATTSVTLNTGAAIVGRALSLNAAVTLDSASVGGCPGAVAPPPPPPASGVAAVPTLGQWGVVLLSSLLLMLAWTRRQRQTR